MSSELWFSLLALAKLNAINKKIEISSIELAKAMSTSQQTASRRILELIEQGWIIRDKMGTKQLIQITPEGQKKLMEVQDSLKKIFEKAPKIIEIEGTLVTGSQEGGYYVTLEGYKKQFLKELEFDDIFAGTLNLKLKSAKSIENIKNIKKRNDIGIKIEGFENRTRTYGDVICHKCTIEDKYEGALLDIKRTHHEENIIEIISPHWLREKLKIVDGDQVKVSILIFD